MNLPKQFTSLHDIDQYFTDENACRKHIEQLRWNSTPACVECGSLEPYRLKDGKHFKCRECKMFFTALTGTIFEGTKIPLIKWFKAIWLITSHKKGVSSCQLARDIKITQKSSWFVLSRLRELIKEKKPLQLYDVVEIDEMYPQGKISNKKKHIRMNHDLKKSYYRKAPVVGLLQRGGNCVLAPFPNFKMTPVLELINKHVVPGSAIFSDSHWNYETLKENYFHKTINHGANEFKKMNVYTNSVEGLFSHAKRSLLGIYHHCSQKHIHRYCHEWSFRYNTRKMSETERFDNALRKMETSRLRYWELIKTE